MAVEVAVVDASNYSLLQPLLLVLNTFWLIGKTNCSTGSDSSITRGSSSSNASSSREQLSFRPWYAQEDASFPPIVII